MIKKTLLITTGLGYILARKAIRDVFKRYDERDTPIVLDIPHTNITFKSENHQLYGNLFGNNEKGLVVFSHGLGWGSDEYFPLINALASNGYQVLAYDATGTFRSQGDSTVGINQSVIDLKHALEYVIRNKNLDYSRLFLVGHSWGGYAVAALLNEKKYLVDGIVSLAGSNSTCQMLWHNSEDKFQKALVGFGVMYHVLSFGKFAFYTAVKGLNKSQVPALIVHGTNDTIVDLKTTSIVSCRNKIHNPKVEYYLMDEDHNSILENEELIQRMCAFFDSIRT